MKRFRIIYLFYLIVITVFSFVQPKETIKNSDKIYLYFVDRQIMKLIPVDYYISSENVSKNAELIIDELIKGRDYNDNIRRIIPNNEKVLDVSVKDGIATVNISTKYLKDIKDGRFIEELFVYQIVNSLSTLNGVKRVKFLIDGRVQKNLFGYLDMREAYIPDYCV